MTTRIVAGHTIRNSDNRCNTCERSVHDIMGNYPDVKAGDHGIACVGVLNALEIDQMATEAKRREALWDAVVGVAA